MTITLEQLQAEHLGIVRSRRQRVDVNTRNLADLDSPPKVRRIDWSHEGRDWLISHLTWAMRSGHSVTLAPAED